MNKDCVAPGASSGVARSAMKAAGGVADWGNHSWVTLALASLRLAGRTGRPPLQRRWESLTLVILIT